MMSGAKKRQAAKAKAEEMKCAVDKAPRLDRFLVHSKTKPDDVVETEEASSSVVSVSEIPIGVDSGDVSSGAVNDPDSDIDCAL